MVRKRKLIFLAIWMIGVAAMAAGAGTIADFSDIEVSTGNTFETGQWRDGTVKIDVKPGSCPNPINVKSGGVLNIAILGTSAFPVDDLVPESVRVWRNVNGDYIGGNVEPLRHSYGDTATPFYPTPGEDICCHDSAGDGIVDLNVQFDKQALIDDLELKEIADDTTRYLRVTVLDDKGNELEGKNCVLILNEPEKSATTGTNTTDDESGGDNPESTEYECEEDVK